MKKKTKKKNIHLCFPTYPTKKIQGRRTANKHFFEDGLICFFFVVVVVVVVVLFFFFVFFFWSNHISQYRFFFLQTYRLFLMFVLSRKVRLGSAPIYAFARHVVSTIMQSNEMSGDRKDSL